jgi:hypothetical protein
VFIGLTAANLRITVSTVDLLQEFQDDPFPLEFRNQVVIIIIIIIIIILQNVLIAVIVPVIVLQNVAINRLVGLRLQLF